MTQFEDEDDNAVRRLEEVVDLLEQMSAEGLLTLAEDLPDTHGGGR